MLRTSLCILLVLLAGGPGQPQPVAADSLELAPTRDATLYEDAQGDVADGSGRYLFIGRTDQPQTRRALLAFDIAGAVPAGATVTAVSLILRQSRTVAAVHTATLHRVRRDWGEGGSVAPGQEGGGASATAGDATWLYAFAPDVPWTAAGGDYDPDPRADQEVAGTGSYTWSAAAMVADVQAWLDAPATNHGWLLLGDESTRRTAKRFDSRQHPTVGNRPRLVVDFVPANAAPVVAAAPADTTLAVGDTLRLDLAADGVFADADGDTLTYAAVSDADSVAAAAVPAGRLAVAATAAGRATITVTATDPAGAGAAAVFTVTVVAPNRAPVVRLDVAPVRTRWGAAARPIVLDQVFADPDGDALTFAATSSDSAVATLTLADGVVTPRGVAPGVAVATLTATDPGGLSATVDVVVEVVGVPGDVDDSGAVDLVDFFLFADHFGRTAADAGWDPAYDLAPDGVVDVVDFFIFADHFGQTLDDLPDPVPQ